MIVEPTLILELPGLDLWHWPGDGKIAQGVEVDDTDGRGVFILQRYIPAVIEALQRAYQPPYPNSVNVVDSQPGGQSI